MTLVLIDHNGRNHRPAAGWTARALGACYAVTAAIALACTFLYAIGFSGVFPVPKGVDTGGGGWAATVALTIDIELLGIFAFLHSGVARSAFERMLLRFATPGAAHSTLVLCSSLVTALLFAAWQPLPAIVWQASDSWIAPVLKSLSLSGWLAVIYAALLSRSFESFRTRHLALGIVGRPQPATGEAPRLYRVMRYPLYLGFALALWSTPVMTAGHFLLASFATMFAGFGIWLEERNLPARFAVLHPTAPAARRGH